jgi:pantetheine-phosphate adenylyltransferase
MAMMEDYVRHFELNNVTIESYEGATVRYAEKIGAQLILKGLRNASDLQAEMEQAIGNRGMNSSIDTITFFTSPRYSVISSSLIRELALLGEDLETYVLPSVAERIREALASQSK